jgi:3,4-dihydroxy 2-butanone 4-phosphate synthase/GTP cyclohydrolase II
MSELATPDVIAAARRGELVVVLEDGDGAVDELLARAGVAPGATLRAAAGANGEEPTALALARARGLPVVTASALLDWERRRAPRVARVSEALLPLAAGVFTAVGYRDADGREHVALTLGDVSVPGALVRLHAQCLLGDALRSHGCDCGALLGLTLERVARAGHGAVVYTCTHAIALPGDGDGDDHVRDARDDATAMGILRDLGVRELRLLTDDGAVATGWEEHGLAVLAHVALRS